MTESASRVTLVTRPGCHLCDDARTIVRRVTSDLEVTWQERSLSDDPALAAAYAELVPVVLVDGEQHDWWRVDEQRLRDALAGRRGWLARWRRDPRSTP